MVRSASLLLCLLAATASVTHAQSKAIRLSPSSSSTVVIGGSRTIPPEILAQLEGRGVSVSGMSVATSGESDDEEAQEKPVDPQRLQMFQQAMLDRADDPATLLIAPRPTSWPSGPSPPRCPRTRTRS